MTFNPTRTTARLLLSIVTAMLSTFAALTATAQTNVTTGGAEVRGFLARSATQVYAAAYGGGLYQSTNAGATWARVDLSGNVRYLTGIAGNTSVFLVIASDEGLLRTTDGTTFTQVMTEPVATVAVGAGASTRVVAAIKGSGIIRSTDSGANWAPANNSGFDGLDIVGLAFDPTNDNNVYAAVKPDGAGSRGGVFLSVDGGANWASYFGTGLPNRYATSVVVDGAGTAYVGLLNPNEGGGGAAYFRTSGGGNWQAATGTFFGIVSLHRDAASGTLIWAGTRGLGLLKGVGVGLDNGYAYNNTGTHSIFYTGVNAAVTLPGSPVALKALKGAGVWRSDANTTPRTWTRVSFPGADRVLSASNVGANAASMLAGLHAGGVWRTNDSGTTWTPPTETPTQTDFAFFTGFINHFISIWDLAASPTNAGLIYAAAGGVGMPYLNDVAGLFRWNGTAWQGVGSNASAAPPANGAVETGPSGFTLPSAQIYGVALNRTDESVAYAGYLPASAGAFTFLRRSGGSWTSVPIPGLTPQVRKILTTPSAPNNVLALVFDDKPALSSNSGVSFTQVTANQLGYERLRFFGAADSPISGNIWLGATNKGLFRSTDNGLNWTRVAAGNVFARQALSAVGFKTNGQAFAADFDGNRYCSANGGATWALLAGQLRAGVNAIKTINGQLYYLTDGAGMIREDSGC